MFYIIVHKLSPGVLKMLRNAQALLTLSSGESSSSSRPETKTRPVRMRLESDFRGNPIRIFK
jgi:hypothetical protein